MKTTVLPELWALHQRIVLNSFTKVSADNQHLRLIPETASVGFLALHLAETMFFFGNMLFGIPMDFKPQTLRVADEGHPIDLDYANTLVHRGLDTLTTAIGQATEAEWDEVISGPLGEMSRMQGLTYLMHHNSHHIGQMVQAMKKGKAPVTEA